MRKLDYDAAIVGAGPIGLAAAAHLCEFGLTSVVLEGDGDIASHVRNWGHVRMFSPWRSLIDPASRRLLENAGWKPPDPEYLPTGDELVERYLRPLSRVPEIATALSLNSVVVSITRRGLDKTRTGERGSRPFILLCRGPDGTSWRVSARTVIDASGTWAIQNPLGADGTPIDGESTFSEKIRYGIPHVLGNERDRYGGKKIAVVGSGYSAANTLVDLLRLREQVGDTRPVWIIRRKDLSYLLQQENDGLPARLALGRALVDRVQSGDLELITEFHLNQLLKVDGKLCLIGEKPNGETLIRDIDEVVCNTGQRPDLEMLRELRVGSDPALECVSGLAPLIDPNVHTCYSVPPHGYKELRNPLEPGLFILGSKSYGRAPTFLLITGYEQARSVASHLAQIRDAAEKVELVQPIACSVIDQIDA